MTADRLQDGVFHRLCREFQQAFIANGAPNEMALFAQAEPSNGTRRVYFTPGCATYVRPLIEGYGGTPCSVPEEASLTLMFGVPGAESAIALSEREGLSGDGMPLTEGAPRLADSPVSSTSDYHAK